MMSVAVDLGVDRGDFLQRPGTQAFTKKPMKPSFTPCFFSNTSLYCARSRHDAPMSTSLKVVSMAAVFCASFRRRGDGLAQARHRHALSRASTGAATGAAGRAQARAGDRRRRRVGSRLASMSPLVTPARLPVPATASARRPFSAATGPRRETGDPGWPLLTPAAAPERPGAGRRQARRGRRLHRGRAPAVRDPAEQRADVTVSPSFGDDFQRTPAARRVDTSGHLVGLELDRAARRPSRIADFLNHLPMVASETDLAEWSERDFVAMFHLFPARAVVGLGPDEPRQAARASSGSVSSSPAPCGGTSVPVAVAAEPARPT